MLRTSSPSLYVSTALPISLLSAAPAVLPSGPDGKQAPRQAHVAPQDLLGEPPGLGRDQVSFSGKAKSTKASSPEALREADPSGSFADTPQSPASLSANREEAPGLSSPRLVAPQLTRSDNPHGLGTLPPLTRKQVDIRPDRLMDRVLLGDQLKLVTFGDLERADLLPKYAAYVSSLKQPLLCSRLIPLDRDRLGGLLYVPGPKNRYIPRPVYQSASRGAWQAPNYIVRGWSNIQERWVTRYFGKGETNRYKLQTALEPQVQSFLSDIQRQELTGGHLDKPVTEDEINTLVGTTYNCASPDERFEQAEHHQHINLEDLYPGSCIDSPRNALPAATKISPLPAHHFKLPEAAMPDFSKELMSYEVQNRLYGSLRAEVYPSKDDRLLWTYHVQPDTRRAWVAFAHKKDSPMMVTGLPFQIVNIGDTITLAPYEHRQELGRWHWLPMVPGTGYADIWNKYTAKGPLVKAYYKAKGTASPPIAFHGDSYRGAVVAVHPATPAATKRPAWLNAE